MPRCVPGALREVRKLEKRVFRDPGGSNTHISNVFDGQPCGFEISLGGLRGSWGRPGATLGGPKSALGGLGGVPRERAPHLEAPRRGLGTHFGDPRERAYSQNTHICEVF